MNSVNPTDRIGTRDEGNQKGFGSMLAGATARLESDKRTKSVFRSPSTSCTHCSTKRLDAVVSLASDCIRIWEASLQTKPHLTSKRKFLYLPNP